MKRLIAPFDFNCIKEMVVESSPGMTTSYVHVVRGERIAGHHDQYWGIQQDLHREYISYTRGKYLCHVWLQEQPFGIPNSETSFEPGSPATKGQSHAQKRNELIRELRLPWNHLRGTDDS